MRLRIKLNSLSGYFGPRVTGHVWLDDYEVTHVLGVEFTFDAGSPPVAILRLGIDELDVDAETLAMLEAHVQGKAAA